MFQDSLVESSGKLKSKSSRYLWITGSLNTAIVIVMVLLPLLHPEALPRAAITAMLSAPPPPAAPAPPHPAPPAKVVRTIAPLSAFTVPARIPTKIDRLPGDAPPPAPSTDVVGMTDGFGSSRSVGAMNTLGIALPPVVIKVDSPRPAGPARVSSGVMAGQIVSKTTPVYPPIARAAHVSGAVVLHAIISKTGSIQSLSVLSGLEMLQASAVAAVQQWRYKPYLLNGEPTEIETTITVNFSLGS